jgi:hypothetical protein
VSRYLTLNEERETNFKRWLDSFTEKFVHDLSKPALLNRKDSVELSNEVQGTIARYPQFCVPDITWHLEI